MTTALSIKNLVKSYGNNQVIKGISFDVMEGEVFALLGTNGAGKTTILECIENLRAYDSGEIELKGKVGVQLQSSSLPSVMKVEEALQLHAKWNEVLLDEELIARLGVNEFLQKKYGELSTGQKRKLHLVLAMIHKPDIVILDEPTAGLDVEGRVALHEEIRRWKETGVTIILASHDMTEVEQLCNRLAIIKGGQLAFNGNVEELTTVFKNTKLIEVIFDKEWSNSHFSNMKLIEQENNKYVFSTMDIAKALIEISQIAINEQVEIQHIELKKATLEQRFMEIAREGNK